MGKTRLVSLLMIIGLSLATTACTVKLEAPDKPIHIIGDFTIKHEVKITVEKDVEKALSEDSGLF